MCHRKQIHGIAGRVWRVPLPTLVLVVSLLGLLPPVPSLPLPSARAAGTSQQGAQGPGSRPPAASVPSLWLGGAGLPLRRFCSCPGWARGVVFLSCHRPASSPDVVPPEAPGTHSLSAVRQGRGHARLCVAMRNLSYGLRSVPKGLSPK